MDGNDKKLPQDESASYRLRMYPVCPMKRLERNVWIIAVVAILGTLGIGLCGCQEGGSILKVDKIMAKRVIKIEAGGDILHYEEALA